LGHLSPNWATSVRYDHAEIARWILERTVQTCSGVRPAEQTREVGVRRKVQGATLLSGHKATRFAVAGGNLPVLSRILGHAALSILMRYIHPSQADMDRASAWYVAIRKPAAELEESLVEFEGDSGPLGGWPGPPFGPPLHPEKRPKRPKKNQFLLSEGGSLRSLLSCLFC
jgi:hypothetical protein